MARMGRPPIQIDFEELEKLMHIQCTIKEIAGWFDCSEDTIENKVKEEYGETFSVVMAKKGAGGKISLRRKQFQTAMAGDKTLLIWLGKQYLGQAEKLEQKIDASKIEINISQDESGL